MPLVLFSINNSTFIKYVPLHKKSESGCDFVFIAPIDFNLKILDNTGIALDWGDTFLNILVLSRYMFTVH